MAAYAPGNERQKRLYLAIVFLYWASLYFYVPTLPVYTQARVESLAMVGTVLAMYGLWQAVLRLPLGIVADWLGRRKPFILSGLVFSAAGAVIMAHAGSAGGMVAGRAVTGLAAASWVPLVVIYTGLFPPAEMVRAAAMLTLVNSASRMFATALNGTLNAAGGYPLAFFVSAAVAATAVLLLLPVREPSRAIHAPTVDSIVRLVTRRDVLLPSLLSAVAQYATWATVFSFIPILARLYGASDVLQGILVSMNIGVVALGNVITAAVVKRVGKRSLLYLSFLILALGVFAVATGRSLLFVVLAQFFIGLSTGINYPILMGMSIEHVDESQRATAMGVYQSVYAIGMFTGPWLSGLMADAMGIHAMFLLTGVVLLVLGLSGSYWLDQPVRYSSCKRSPG
ncbi:MAG TPA: MFS transporter [Levilinea sp.]|nr:MFS transporter [Levilinea sp.]